MKLMLILCTILTAASGYAVANDDLLFSACFDDTLTADKASGKNTPVVKRMEQSRFADGVAGKCIRMNQNSRIEYKAEKNFNPEQGTVAFWIRPADWNPGLRTNTYHWIFSVTKSGTDVDRFQLFKMPGPLMMLFFGPKDNIKKLSFSLGKWKIKQWHFIAFSWDRTLVKLYVDGSLLQTVKLPENQTSLDLSSDIAFQGGLETTDYDNLQIYKRPLSDSEIKALYAAGAPGESSLSSSDKRDQVSAKPFKEESVKVEVSPAVESDFARMNPGVIQHVNVKYTYDVVPKELLNGLLFRGTHRVPAGTGIKITLLEPALIYFFFHPSADGGYTNIFLDLKDWEVCDTAPQYDIKNGTHGLKMTMYYLKAEPGTYVIPATTKDNACFNMVFCSRK